jgi:ABC transporter substrate binding protein
MAFPLVAPWRRPRARHPHEHRSGPGRTFGSYRSPWARHCKSKRHWASAMLSANGSLSRPAPTSRFRAVTGWPVGVRGQQIGFLSSRSPVESHGVVAAFRQGLGEAGFVEGQNLAIEFRWAEGRYDRLSALAADLVRLQVVALFAAGGEPSARAAKAATSTIAIVFSAVNDPVQPLMLTLTRSKLDCIFANMRPRQAQ